MRSLMSHERFCLASCQHCGQHIEFPAAGTGMSVACPHCEGETMLAETLPTGSESTEADEITAGELKAALAGTVPRRRISILYQIGLLVVALFMVLLPLAYLGFATFDGYCTYWYGVHALGLFASLSGGLYFLFLKAILYVGPLLGGTVAVFFMFKPILARGRKRAPAIELNPALHPRLYQFIAHVSDLLRVPMPRRIYLGCELNASAGFRQGWFSFLGNRLELHLGLPLVAGLNTRQFAAVVAHELGHCTQSFAMRLGHVIDQIDGWFMRVVYERDTWDDAFEEWANSVQDWRLSIVVACAGLAVWLSRKMLLLLLLTGHAASCFLSRQMEYHADSCAIAVAGSAGLESLLLRLREQAVLQGLAYESLKQIWKRRHLLPDSFPDFLDQLEQRLPPGFHEQARQTLLNETSGWFATHPTAVQRIKSARRQAVGGIFALERPARRLFNDFAGASRVVTGRHYRDNLRLAATDRMLKPVCDFFPDRGEHPPEQAAAI
jgi:Zn-dependent protease with chaperone function